MKFKHIIGLDIGTNSLGWSLIKEFENGKIEIIKTGVHIFPIGTIVDDKSNKEKTKNEQRRGYRGASRNRYRFKIRRKNLKEILEKLEMLPDYKKLEKPYSNKEKRNIDSVDRGQSYNLYKLRADAINPEIKIEKSDIGRIFMLLNKYRGFKSNSKILDNNDKEIGEVKKGHENLQRLIDNSGAQTIGEYFFKMHEKAKEMYEANDWHNFNEPIDERAYLDEKLILFNSNGIRRHHGRYTLRDMYLKEFDLIWSTQKKNYPSEFTGSWEEFKKILQLPYKERITALKEFKKTNYWHIREYCLYYQRPLKSQKKYVSNCQFERGMFDTQKLEVKEGNIFKTKVQRIWKKKAKKACPKSHPLFQEFKIWQKLHQISYSSTETETFKKPLLKEWLPILADALMNNYELHLNSTTRIKKENKPYFGKLLQEKGLIQNPDNHSFYIDKADEDVVSEEKNENKISGNITYASFKAALGEETFHKIMDGELKMTSRQEKEIKHSTLEELWHHLYMAKDGLFKEDSWLKCVLTEKSKWNFTEHQANELISKGLVPDYGSYSGKVLKAILPFMRKGLNEYEALKATGFNYVNEDNTLGEKIQLRDKISQLKYQELRNPVVERSLTKSIKLVNTILERYKTEIDRDTFEIRIESMRQLRKPRQERENERRKNADKDRLREQYASFLTKNKQKLGLNRDIFKHDSIVGKYELWLQMNMNEEDEVFINEFKSFSKISKQEDKLKHKLWLECGRRCPYTGDIINLSDCFSSEIEIEHIIPLSRSLDDSFNNKTLTYRKTNAEKGSLTPLEFLEKKGGSAVSDFKALLKSKYHNFSDDKKKLLLAENIKADFSSNQITNSSYIAKFTRKKMQEVCRNVQFTNGAATSELRNYDWSLSNLLDKIRYEEDYNINMDEVYRNYYTIKKSFIIWYEKMVNSTDFKINWKKLNDNKYVVEFIKETNDDLLYWFNQIEAFNQFRNKSGKKDRSDHRHHSIDAFVTACTSPRIIQTLSTLNAVREQNNLRDRDKFEKCFDYEKLKNSIASILVSHSEKQTLIKKRKNRIRTKKGVIINQTYSPQGALHKETFYGKLTKPINQGYAKNNVYVSRSILVSKNGSSETYLFDAPDNLEKVYDKGQKRNLAQRFDFIKKLNEEKGISIKPFSEKAMKEYPFFSNTSNSDKTKSQKGKTLPVVKSIKTKYKNEKSLIRLPDNKYADKEGNYLMVLYEKKVFDKKGNPKKSNRDFKLISFWDGVALKSNNDKLFIDETEEGLGLYNQCQWIQKGDLVLIQDTNNLNEEIDWNNNYSIARRLYKVNELGSDEREKTSYAVIKFEPHNRMKTSNDSYKAGSKFPKLSETSNITKVRLNILGEIEAKGEECFNPIDRLSNLKHLNNPTTYPEANKNFPIINETSHPYNLPISFSNPDQLDEKDITFNASFSTEERFDYLNQLRKATHDLNLSEEKKKEILNRIIINPPDGH
jgi:CRISPR-associated endonuclease Csn1